jgi:CRAL/TRIO domain
MGCVCGHLLGSNDEETRRSGTPDETRSSESIFFDARQSMTESMMYAPANIPCSHPRGSIVMDDPQTLLHSVTPVRRSIILRKHLEEPRVKVEQRGYPGDLTDMELDACLKLRRILREKEDPSYQAIINALAPVEEEPYALCRSLRARDFKVEDTMKMLEESVVHWKEMEENDFYPTIEDAVVCPGSVFLTQYPYLFSGKAKNGCPISYQMMGRIRAEGIECVTALDRVKCYAVHSVMHQFKKEVAIAQADDPDIVRCECVTVIDLKGLDSSQLNKKTLATLGSMAAYMGCFPELLNHMIVINAPMFFGVFWSLIKAFLHPKTVAKIEIYTNESKGRQRLLELVDTNELLVDYGGQGPSFDVLVQKIGSESGATRQTAELMKGGEEPRFVGELTPAEKATVRVYSRSGGKVSFLKDNVLVKTVELESANTSFPQRTEIASDEKGPGKLNVSISGSKSDHFLVHVEVFALNLS